MQCSDFREVADSYLSDELLVETNHDMIAHLERCAECRRELAARRELRVTLRASFANSEELRLPDQFAEQLPTRLRAQHAARSSAMITRRRVGIAIAACLLLTAVGFVAVKQRQRSQASSSTTTTDRDPHTTDSKSSEMASHRGDNTLIAGLIPDRLSELAAGDHHDCAIGHRLPERPIDLEKAGREYDPAYINLARTVMAHRQDFTEPIEMVAAHWCVFNGRPFAHIVLRQSGRLASLLVTPVEQTGDLSARPAQFDPAYQVMTCAKARGYQISCFRTPGHAVFVVSDLGETDNLALARKLAPPVYKHITEGEGKT
ncbi:MAG TPA: hypothetical protein VFS77_15115 [Pyrinomonadaceae bacterium]|nr:hypothetical protein [Pyrinomonadaceae bacterium]